MRFDFAGTNRPGHPLKFPSADLEPHPFVVEANERNQAHGESGLLPVLCGTGPKMLAFGRVRCAPAAHTGEARGSIESRRFTRGFPFIFDWAGRVRVSSTLENKQPSSLFGDEHAIRRIGNWPSEQHCAF